MSFEALFAAALARSNNMTGALGRGPGNREFAARLDDLWGDAGRRVQRAVAGKCLRR